VETNQGHHLDLIREVTGEVREIRGTVDQMQARQGQMETTQDQHTGQLREMRGTVDQHTDEIADTRAAVAGTVNAMDRHLNIIGETAFHVSAVAGEVREIRGIADQHTGQIADIRADHGSQLAQLRDRFDELQEQSDGKREESK